MAKTYGETQYTALMKHNSETIEKLVLMQYNTFQTGNKVIKITIAAVMIAYGVITAGSGMITSYLCLFLGCVLLAGLNVRAKSNAKKIIAQMDGRFPESEYHFSREGFRDSDNSREIPYRNLIKIIDDQSYLYLYITKESAYMVNSRSVYGKDGLTGLKDLISEKTGMKWEKPASFWNFNINTLRDLTGKNKQSFTGERLRDNHK